MIKDQYKRLLVISLVIIFSLATVMTVIVSANFIHIEQCGASNCLLCNLINLSSNFLKNISLINNSILILIIIVPLMQLINNNTKKESKLTLVELKVRQNK